MLSNIIVLLYVLVILLTFQIYPLLGMQEGLNEVLMLIPVLCLLGFLIKHGCLDTMGEGFYS